MSVEATELGPSRPTQCPGKCMSRNSRTLRAQCGGHHLAGTSHLAADIPTGVTETTLCQGNPDNNVESHCIFNMRWEPELPHARELTAYLTHR
jgi:hypothetical protein